jgi:hypothetical protein
VQRRARFHVRARLHPVASCHTDRCPTGVATQDPKRWRALDVPDKAQRVADFHRTRCMRCANCCARRAWNTRTSSARAHPAPRLADRGALAGALYAFLQPGELLERVPPEHAVFQRFWAEARADSFEPPASLTALRASKSI